MTTAADRRHRRRARPRLEGLEDRKLLYATLGGAWAYGGRITYSFAPDGTNVGGTASDLQATMAGLGHAGTWKNEVRRAASVWQAVAGINLAEVADNGSDLGKSGANQQNDARFGDIRVAGLSLNPGTLAQAYYPPPFNGGALAGDILLNTDVNWKVNGSTYDLQTVAIHEFGHALGLGHSAIASAVMYASYTASKQALTADDVGGIQSVYGDRQDDFLDANGSNNSLATADVITSYINASTGKLALSGLEINSNADNDFYKIVVPAVSNNRISVTVQSSGLSSLSPKLWLYTGSQQQIAAVGQANSYGGTVSITYSGTGITPGTTFYIRVNAANTGPSGTGAYGLLVNFTTSTQAPIAPPDTTVTEQADQGGGGSGLGGGLLGGLLGEVGNLVSAGSLTGFGHALTIHGCGHDHGDGGAGHDHGEEPGGCGCGTTACPHAGFGPASAAERPRLLAEAIAPPAAADAPIAPITNRARNRPRDLSPRALDALLPHWGRRG